MLQSMTPGETSYSLEAQFSPKMVVPDVAHAPGGLFPLQAAVYEMDEYRVMNGWPVPVPTYDVYADTMVSLDGEILSDRPDPNDITTNAFLRWTAGDSYDTIRNIWSPMQGPQDLVWQTADEYAPVLAYNYEYEVKDERFLMETLNFDSDTYNHMWLSLNSVLTGAAGYTVILVLSPNSIYGNDTDVPFNGIWCPGRPTPHLSDFTEDINPNWNSVTIQGNYFYLGSEVVPRTRTVPCATQLNSSTPSYVAINFARPSSTIYVASGPNSLLSKTIRLGNDAVPLDYGVVLGRSTGDIRHTADMALFDVGIYAENLTAEEIRTEIATLSQVYGGDA